MNVETITEQLDVPIENGSLERAYVEMGENETHAYLRMNDVLSGEDADESTLRSMSMISEETTIHMADAWDSSSRDFPSLDTDAVRSYVPASSPSDSDGGTPMTLVVGAGLGLVAILVAIGAVVWNRRGQGPTCMEQVTRTATFSIEA